MRPVSEILRQMEVDDASRITVDTVGVMGSADDLVARQEAQRLSAKTEYVADSGELEEQIDITGERFGKQIDVTREECDALVAAGAKDARPKF
jgi:hypothetical protein